MNSAQNRAKVLSHAADLIEETAEALREGETLNGEWPDTGPMRDTKARLDYEDMIDTARILKAMTASSGPVVGSVASEWPARDIVRKLVEAADILLDRHSYDGDGWEEIHLARSLAHSWAESPNTDSATSV